MAQRRQPNNKQPKPAAKPQTLFDKRAIITDGPGAAFMQDNRKVMDRDEICAGKLGQPRRRRALRRDRSGAPAPRP